MEMVAPGKAMVRWRQPDVRDSEGTNSWESVEEAVSQNAQSFALLQQIIAKPEFDFQINYNQGVADLNFTNFYLAESKRAAQRLGTAALCDLHQGNTASTVTNLQTMLAIVKAMRNKRLVISELVRIAIANIALTVNWEVLQSTNMTDEQLTELQQDWASLDFILNGENTLAMERVIGEITLAKWRSSSLELQHYYFDLGKRAREAMGLPDENGTFWDQTRMTTKTFMWHYWWSYPDELRALRGYEVLLDTVRFAETNDSFQTALNDQESQLAALGIDKLDDEFSTSFDPEKIDMHSTLSQSIVALSGTVRRVMTAETAKEVVITAIALKRYQLKHGNYPPDLNSLVPEFLADSSTRSGGRPAVALPAECRRHLSALFRRRKRQGRRRRSFAGERCPVFEFLLAKSVMRWTGSGRNRRHLKKSRTFTSIRQNNFAPFQFAPIRVISGLIFNVRCSNPFSSRSSHWYLGALKTGGYPLIVLLMTMESSFLPLPSEVIIPPAAHLAWSGGGLNLFQFHLSGWPAQIGIVVTGAFGSWLGATIMYWLARVAGRPLVLRYGRLVLFPPEKLEKAERWMAHYGAMGVFVARLLPGARQLVGIPTGIARMDYRLFSLFTLLGATIWCSVLCWLGINIGADITKGRNAPRDILGGRHGARARWTLLFLRPPAHGGKAEGRRQKAE